MKKEAIIIFILITIFISLGEQINGEITGQASGQSTNVSIVVINAPPSITIITPENETYLKNISLLLNYSASGEEAVWYNIDEGTNTTITSSIYFNTSEGAHTLNLYANNTDGTISLDSVNFTVNLNLFAVLYNEYNGSYKGSSTDFLTHSYEDLQSLGSIVLENTQSGKIKFNEAINVTNDFNLEDSLTDLDTNVNISFNKIELNTTALPNFDKSATISLYNLVFTNPRILKDGSVCPSNICTLQSYSGTLVFNITEFGTYTSEETPSEEGGSTSSSSSSSSGRGSTETTKTKEIFKVDKELFKVNIKQEEKFETSFTIKNIDTQGHNFTIEAPLENYLNLSEKEFYLEQNQTKEILLTFYSTKYTKPGVYPGEIKIISAGITKKIPVILEIETEKVLFDVTLDIPSEYKEIYAGQDLLLQITIFDLGKVGTKNVNVTCIIKNINGEEIFSEAEIVEVKNQLSFSKTIKLSKNLKIGEYVAIVQVEYAKSVGTSSDIFHLIEKKNFFSIIKKYFVLLLLILIILITIIVSIIKHERKKLKTTTEFYAEKINRFSKKLKEKDLRSNETKTMSEKLKKELGLLEKAYSEGYIKKDSYQKSKTRILELNKKLKRKYL